MIATLSRPFTVGAALPDEAATAALAANIAALAQAGDVIALSGDLGAGKTVFARAFIRSLPPAAEAHGAQTEDVPSPTFTLVQVYERSPAPVWHVDLYRLETPEEVYELGLEDAFAEAILLIEWPERMGNLLPREHLEVRLDQGETPSARRATLVAGGSWVARLRTLEWHA